MTTAVEIRRAALADLASLAARFDCYRQFYGQVADLQGAAAFLGQRLARGDSVVFLAQQLGESVGFTQLYPSFTSAGMAPIYVLNDLFVAPEARGRGVATALLRHATGFARGEGAVRLTLSTATGNASAQALYKREGWARDEAFFVYNLPLAAP